jgi:KAP family P-loop domain/Clp amino terminal domain, pathogenicity island component/AAA lid domain
MAGIYPSTMSDRLSEPARVLLRVAEQEAAALNHHYLRPEHLILGLIRVRDRLFFDVLAAAGTYPMHMRQIAMTVIEPGVEAPGAYIPRTPRTETIIAEAFRECSLRNDEHITTAHILLALVRKGEGLAAEVFAKFGLEYDHVRVKLDQEEPTQTLVKREHVGWNLTADQNVTLTESPFEREREIEQIMRILTRSAKNCPVLIGDDFEDRMAVAKSLARRIAGPTAPYPFSGVRVVALAASDLRDMSDFEVFFGGVDPWKLILFFTEELDGDLLRGLLSTKGLRIVSGTTYDKYRELVEVPEFERRIQSVEMVEPTVADVVKVLEDDRNRHEEYDIAAFADASLVTAAQLAELFISDLPAPDSAFDLLDEARSTARLRGSHEVTEDLIVEIVAARAGVPVARVRGALPSKPVPLPAEPDYTLLTDQPVETEADDLLGTTTVAQGIANILAHAASPFVLAVDGSWGVGKSTLLRQIETALPGAPNMVKVRFNAWTAQGENALEALIKSVIAELDSNLLRRWLRGLAKRQRAIGLARVSLAVVARFFGVTRLVDELWHRLQANAASRNEFRTLVQGMLADWLQRPGKPRRTLVAFIDDLDRCADDVVVKVCEAVKLYLDAPGLVFVIGCDLSVLARGVATKARGGEGEGRTYLEKIVQVVHRVPAPDQDGIATLIRGYADRAGTAGLVDDTIVDILSTRTGRNPRRIKRIINSFVLEHSLNPAWRRPPLGSAQLIAVIILQHLYPQFYERLTGEGAGAGDDPISEFLDYATVRARAANPSSTTGTWWATASRVFRRYGAPPPNRDADLSSHLDRFELFLPPWFPELALNEDLLALLREIGGVETRRALRAQLVNRPLATGAFPE